MTCRLLCYPHDYDEEGRGGGVDDCHQNKQLDRVDVQEAQLAAYPARLRQPPMRPPLAVQLPLIRTFTAPSDPSCRCRRSSSWSPK